jgi:hypothetical protein
MDTVTEVSSSGIFSRIGQSLVGALIGLLLLVGSVLLLYWNEGRAVIASSGLAQGQKELVEVAGASIDPRNNNRLVHLSGLLSAAQPAQDEVFGVIDGKQLLLRRKVEMYQWRETKSSHSSTAIGGTKTTETTYDYSRVWSEQPIDSSLFRSSASHHNPEMPLRSATAVSQSAMLQAFDVDPALLERCKQLSPVSDTATPPAGYRQDNGTLYRGNPASPQVGDVRVSFSGLQQQTISVVAQQSSGTLAPFHASNGYVIAMIEPGVVDAKTLFAQTRSEENSLTWILRGVGFVLMLVGFMLALRPLSVLGSVLPFLGGLIEAGAFFFALAMALPLTLVTIAFAWLAHRPLLGGALLAAAGIAFFLSWRHRPRRNAGTLRPA